MSVALVQTQHGIVVVEGQWIRERIIIAVVVVRQRITATTVVQSVFRWTASVFALWLVVLRETPERQRGESVLVGDQGREGNKCLWGLFSATHPDGDPFCRYVNSDLKGLSIFPCGLLWGSSSSSSAVIMGEEEGVSKK